MNYKHAQRVRLCCHNTDLVHANGHYRIILVIFSQALYVQGSLMMDPLRSETRWSAFKYFIILIVSTYYILFISWIIKCLIIIDERCKYENSPPCLSLNSRSYSLYALACDKRIVWMTRYCPCPGVRMLGAFPYGKLYPRAITVGSLKVFHHFTCTWRREI